jgi:ABC-type bacteriocin/lantibiotic exporter with double-glycine peptidase domain
MTLAVILIFAGILIAIYPELLSLIVSFILIAAGLSVLFIRYYTKNISKQWDDSPSPFMKFFMRF